MWCAQPIPSGAQLCNVDPLDTALAWLPLSVLFTAFAVGGVANAVNIIDGFNGLASGTVIIGLVALGFIADGSGDPELALAWLHVLHPWG